MKLVAKNHDDRLVEWNFIERLRNFYCVQEFIFFFAFFRRIFLIANQKDKRDFENFENDEILKSVEKVVYCCDNVEILCNYLL